MVKQIIVVWALSELHMTCHYYRPTSGLLYWIMCQTCLQIITPSRRRQVRQPLIHTRHGDKGQILMAQLQCVLTTSMTANESPTQALW